MKLDLKALSLALGLLWGGALLVIGGVAAMNGVHDGGYYGKDFLLVMASVYPGYDGVPAWGDALIGGAYGFVDGLVGGALLGWLYNRCTSSSN